MKHRLLSCVESRIENNRSFYGRFKLGPFEEGEGVTVANSLRRSLLSDIPGLAITAVKIKGVTSEYSTVVGVREKVLDILLSLKQIVLTSDFQIQNPQVGYLHVQGPGIVKAKDLRLPTSIKCVDPEQHIATLVNNGVFSMKLLICKGKRYFFQTPLGLALKSKNITSRIEKHVFKVDSRTNPYTFYPYIRKRALSPFPSYAHSIIPLKKKISKKRSENNLVQTNILIKKLKSILPAPFTTPSDGMDDKIVESTYAKVKVSGLKKLPIQTSSLPLEQVTTNSHLDQTTKLVPAKESELLISDKLNGEGIISQPSVNNAFSAVLESPLLQPPISLFHKFLSINKNLKKYSNVLPVDAVFMPVNKVSFVIEKTDNFERTKDVVILEVWTNGSIHPRQAIYKATKAVIQLISPFQEPNSVKKTFLQRGGSGSPNKLVKINSLQKNSSFLIPRSAKQVHSTSFLPSSPTKEEFIFADFVQQGLIPSSDFLWRSKDSKERATLSCFGKSGSSLQNQSSVVQRSGLFGRKDKQVNVLFSEQVRFLQNSAASKTDYSNFRSSKRSYKNVLSLDIGNLDLQLSTYTVLKKNNIQTIGDLLNRSVKNLLDLQGFKSSFLVELNNNLEQIGLKW